MKIRLFAKYILPALVLVSSATLVYALKFEIPDELQDEFEAIKAAEKAAIEEKLEQVASGDGPPAGQMTFGQTGSDASDVAEEETGFEEVPAEEGGEVAFVIGTDDIIAPETFGEGQGRIAGQVFDKESGQPVRGVAILVEGTDLGTITDSQGRYRLNNVPSGEYALSFFKSGYIEATVTETRVAEGETMKLDFALPPRPVGMSDEVYVLQDFTVTAEEAVSQNVALLSLRKTSIASIDALSSEDFSKFAASDVAEAVTKVSGASLSDGKYLVFRGLNDRYNTVLINGVVLPSPDPDRKAIALDIFPTSLVESIVASKTYTSDMPGESSGGSVNLMTKSIPDEFFAKLSFGMGGQFTSSDTEDFLSDPEQVSLLGWLKGEDHRGFNLAPGTNDLVSDYPTQIEGVDFPLMAPSRKKMSGFGDRSYSFSTGGSNSFTDWLTLGAVLGIKVSEKQRNSFKETFEIDIEDRGGQPTAILNEVSGPGLVELGVLAPEEATLNGEPFGGILKSEQEYAASVLFGLGAQIADHTTLNYNFLRSESLTSTVELAESYKFLESPPGGLDSNEYYKFLDIELSTQERLLEAHQFSGEHIFELPEADEWTFSWYYTAAQMEQNEPDQRFISDWPLDFDGFDTVVASVPPVTRFQRETEQASDMMGFNLKKEIEVFDDAITLGFEFGYDSEDSERDFRQLDTSIFQEGEVDDSLYAAMPFPNGGNGLLGDITSDGDVSLYNDAFVDEDLAGGVNELVEALFENQVSNAQTFVTSAQNGVNDALDDLDSAETNLDTAETNLQGAIESWETQVGVDYETEFDPDNPFHVFGQTVLQIPDLEELVVERMDELDIAQSDLTLAQNDLSAVNDDLTTIQDEQSAYLADAATLISQIQSMPALATDVTAFPTFSFLGNQDYILETPRGFSIYADESPTISNIQFSSVDGLTQARGENKVKSFYVSGNLKFNKVPVFESIRAAGGFRRESTELSYDIVENNPGEPDGAAFLDATVAEPSRIDQNDDLGYLAVIFEITENLKLHLSHSTTVAKPTFREIAPFGIFNLTDESVEFGNPGFTFVSSGKYLEWLNGINDYAAYNPADPAALRDPNLSSNLVVTPEFAGLEIAEVESRDIRLEYFTPLDGLIAIGYFQKDVGAPIERVFAFDNNGVNVNTFINNDNDADLSGFEIELQQNLGIFNEWIDESWLPLDWITIGGNYTKIDAEVQRSGFELRNLNELDGINLERPLYDQPSFVANAFITLDFEKTGTSITLSQNWLGEQLNRVGGLDDSLEGTADIYWGEFTSMNLVIEQELTDHIKLKFAVKNLNSPVRSTFEDSTFYDSLEDAGLFDPSDTQLSNSAGGFDRSTQTVEPTYSISISGSF